MMMMTDDGCLIWKQCIFIVVMNNIYVNKAGSAQLLAAVTHSCSTLPHYQFFLYNKIQQLSCVHC